MSASVASVRFAVLRSSLSGMTPDGERAAYRILFTKVLGHRDASEGPCPRCEPELAVEYDRVLAALGVRRES
jgi:hypothetical protein